MAQRRPFALVPAAVALAVVLAACGSQLDPDTVARANGTSGLGPAGTTGEVLGDGTVTDGGGTAAGPGEAGGSGTTSGGDPGSAGGTGDGDDGGTDGTDPVIAAAKKVDCDGFKNQTGITDDKIVIANASDLSGPVPGLFQSTSDAVRAFAMYFNANGDICGRKLEVLSLDTRTDAGADQQAYAKACDSAFAAVGSMSAFDSGGAGTAQACGIPDLRATSVTPERSACKTCFGAQSNNSNYFENAVPDFVKKYYPAASQKGAMVYLNAGAAAVNAKGQIKVMTKRGVKFVYTQGVDTSEFNYGPFVQQMKDKGVKYVQWLGSYQHGIRLAQQMQKDGFKPDLFLFDVVAYDTGFVEQGGSAVDGVVAFMNFTPFEEAASNAEMSLYLKYLKQVNPNADPSFFGVFAWSAARLFVTEALALGGRLNRDTMISRIQGVNGWTAGGMHAPQYVGSKKLADCWRFLKLSGGKWAPIGGSKYWCNGATPVN